MILEVRFIKIGRMHIEIVIFKKWGKYNFFGGVFLKSVDI